MFNYLKNTQHGTVKTTTVKIYHPYCEVFLGGGLL